MRAGNPFIGIALLQLLAVPKVGAGAVEQEVNAAAVPHIEH